MWRVFFLPSDLPPDVLQTFVPGMVPTRLRMVTADAIFRNVCCRNGIIIGAEPISLRKIVRFGQVHVRMCLDFTVLALVSQV